MNESDSIALDLQSDAIDAVGARPKVRVTLTKQRLADVLAQHLGLNQCEASEMIERFFAELVRALATGRQVKLADFGRFALRMKPARPGRNPKTGELIPIAPRRVVTFRPSPMLRQRVDGNHRWEG